MRERHRADCSWISNSSACPLPPGPQESSCLVKLRCFQSEGFMSRVTVLIEGQHCVDVIYDLLKGNYLGQSVGVIEKTSCFTLAIFLI